MPVGKFWSLMAPGGKFLDLGTFFNPTFTYLSAKNFSHRQIFGLHPPNKISLAMPLFPADFLKFFKSKNM
jgi:hypothetical protein